MSPAPYGHISLNDRDHVLVPADDPRITATMDYRLTPREWQIAEMLASDMVTKQIADTLKIDLHTVTTHIRRAFMKLNVSTRAGLVGAIYRAQLAVRAAA